MEEQTMFSQRKQDPFFFSLLTVAENVQDAAHYANDFKIVTVADLKEVSIKLKNYETAGDDLIHELITMLNKSFMTPIEREDILQLAIKMDDILDGIEHFAAHLEMFSLIEIDEYVQGFMDNIVKSTDEIVQAMKLLSRKKLVQMRDHAVQIKEYERICDEILRTSIKQLFINEKDPIRIIQFKDIYEQLEDIADYCQDVANTIETIIMRNA
jgi:predicted phosphate transport protein (TIGR00153 family)